MAQEKKPRTLTGLVKQKVATKEHNRDTQIDKEMEVTAEMRQTT
jgi:hypothetical protein